MNAGTKMNTRMKWIQEWNEYRNKTECSPDGNKGTNQSIIESTKKMVEWKIYA